LNVPSVNGGLLGSSKQDQLVGTRHTDASHTAP
jgi:hypothetical protein